MTDLKEYRLYWETMARRVPAIGAVQGLTVEANMADKVARMAATDGPVLFYLPPTAEGRGGVDSFAEDNMCVVFVMQKYNPRTATSAETLEAVQPVMEAVKLAIVEDSRCPCRFPGADVSTMSTLPETEFFGNWAGWSLGFTVKSR